MRGPNQAGSGGRWSGETGVPDSHGSADSSLKESVNKPRLEPDLSHLLNPPPAAAPAPATHAVLLRGPFRAHKVNYVVSPSLPGGLLPPLGFLRLTDTLPGSRSASGS